MRKSSKSKRLSKAERSWIFVDVGNSAFATSILSTLFPIYLSKLVPAEGVMLLGWKSSGLSIWGYGVSLSALGTLVMSLLVGSWADRMGMRRLCYLVASVIGAIATCFLSLLESWQALIICFMIANIGFAGSIVFSNSLLKFVTAEENWDALSLKAYAWGYISGGIMLALNLALIMKPEFWGLADAGQATRVSFFMVGIWWLLWSIPAYLKTHETHTKSDEKLSLGYQLKQLKRTILELPKRPAILWFILAYFFMNEGVQTVIAMASPFASETLKLDQSHIIATFLIIQIVGWPLTLSMIKFSSNFGPVAVLKASMIFWILITGFAFFMTSSTHFLILGLMVAIVLGVSQAIPRSIYARLIPSGKEAEYYSLYGLSGRSNPILGPLIFSLVADLSSDGRIAIFSLASFFLLSLIPLHFVSIDRSSRG